MNKFLSQIQSKKVLIFGIGIQGGGAGDTKWLTEHGAIVKVSDRNLSLCPEGQTESQIDWAEIIIKNPAVADDHPLILRAKSQNKPVFTSIALFVKYSPVKTIGVTGTRGKSTTVALITAVLEAVYPGQIISGGNIAGTSCLSLFDQVVGKKYAVLELSSFQLHNFHDLKISPNYAILTNIYPDHLNRYSDMESYQKDKEAIHLFQKPGDIFIKYPDPDTVREWETLLPGIHNRENIAGMWSLLSRLAIPETTARQVVAKFTSLPFRQEIIAVKKGVTYINDTTSTTPIAAIKALQATSSSFIWITGGDSKNLPFEQLLQEVKVNPRLKGIVILGSKNIPTYTNALTNIVGDKIIGWASSIPEAVQLATKSAQEGDTILLSPAFASFDLFQNEFDRGRQFNDYVKTL
ncbi:MAG: UDP-N-acetylmuramoylalanine-D-glutamate ligase [Microgenomates group bacterium GW2011_GWA2_46_7]|nr:MAG: UDP-N-acetylmuramoylalanine-D-glutamate ligase [Microgenomates group bacterium GW2011_GWA2_46_7]